MKNPYGITMFCDDFRVEADGKFIFIGVYPGDLNIEAKPPVVFPSFSAIIQLRIPIEIKISSLKVLITKKTPNAFEEIARIEHDFNGGLPSYQAPPEALRVPDDEVFMHFSIPVSWKPFHINESCALRVQAIVNNDIKFKAGGVRLNIINPETKKIVI